MGNAEHVPIVNAAFTPTADEVAYWSEIDRLTREAEAADDACPHGRQEPGRRPRDPHRARRDGPQAARLGARAGSRNVSTHMNAAEVRAGPLASDHRRRRPLRRARAGVRRGDAHLPRGDGRAGRARPVREQHRAHRHDHRARRAPGCTRPGLEGDAVVVGLADEEHPRPGDVVSPGPALRTARRDRHRLHDPVSVDDALVPRDRPTTSSSACAAAPRTARSRTSSRRTAIARPWARSCRCSTRSSRSTSSSTRSASSASRPPCSPATPAGRSARNRAANTGSTRFGVDSAYDYDPLWAKCVELGIAPVFHSSLQSHRVTRSATSYVYNHIGGLAANHESLCKSLFLSGVTHRFPTLRFGFLEGGVAWACSLFSDLVGHWAEAQRERHPEPRPRPPRRRRARRAVRPSTATPGCVPGSSELHTYFSRPSGRPGAARRVRGRRAALGRRPARQVRPELLLRLRGRRPARRVGVRRAHQSGRCAAAPDLRLRHLALGRAGHDRTGRRGVRARHRRRSSASRSSAS